MGGAFSVSNKNQSFKYFTVLEDVHKKFINQEIMQNKQQLQTILQKVHNMTLKQQYYFLGTLLILSIAFSILWSFLDDRWRNIWSSPVYVSISLFPIMQPIVYGLCRIIGTSGMLICTNVIK